MSEAEDAELSVFGHGEKDLLLMLVEFLDVKQHINFERMGVGHEEGHKLIVERNLETCEGVLVHPWSRFGEPQFVELFLGEGEIDSAFVISLAINPAFEPMLLVIPDDVVCLVCLLLGEVLGALAFSLWLWCSLLGRSWGSGSAALRGSRLRLRLVAPGCPEVSKN